MGFEVRVIRVYDPPEPHDGARVLVDRLWPRGLAKARAELDEWCKDVAPSDELRTWYAHDPDLFDQFVARYRIELTDPVRAAALESLRERGRQGPVTLLTAVRALAISHATVLAGLITEDG
jgi:uncharacterized protein YeaO (DUF488 family)